MSDTSNNKTKIVVAMSGGVDSAVAAYLAKEMGYDPIGVTLRLAPDNNAGDVAKQGRCCSMDDMIDARLVCDKIGIPFFAIDAREKFKKVVFDPFVNSYKNGETPIPCLACNHEVKFGDLYETAKKLNARIATGHYAKVSDFNGQKTLAKPYDLNKDQTYYLYGMAKEVLGDLILPLGGMNKSEVRQIAKKIGLKVHEKKDSHEICFVPNGDHGTVIEKASNIKNKAANGLVLNSDGQSIGEHNGIYRYTIGQRRGLNISSKDPRYVADIDAHKNSITLAPKEQLACQKIKVKEMNFLVPINFWPKKFEVKVRARSFAQSASLISIDEKNNLILQFDEAAFAVSLGQAAVFYSGDHMLGGGIISGRLDGAFPRQSS